MFCTNCGNQINDGTRFCPFCGASASEAQTPPQPQMTPQQQTQMGAPSSFAQQQPAFDQQPTMQQGAGYALPPGIEYVEGGPFYWTYSQSLWSNPTILYTLLKVMLLSVAIVILIAGVAGGFKMKNLLMLGGGLALGAIVLSLIGYAIFAAISGGKYNMLFLMDDDCVVHVQMPKEAERGDAISDVAGVVGVLTGNLTLMGTSMAQYGRHTMTSTFSNVKSITQDRAHDVIKIRAGVEFNQIYANPAQYDFVLSYIASRCPNVRVE